MAKVKISYQELIKLQNALLNIEARGKGIPGEAWLGISNIKYKIQSHFNAVIEARDKVLEKYVDKEGNDFRKSESGMDFEYKSDEAREKYNDEMDPLLEKTIEVQIEKIDKTKIAKATFDSVPNITTFFHFCVK